MDGDENAAAVLRSYLAGDPARLTTALTDPARARAVASDAAPGDSALRNALLAVSQLRATRALSDPESPVQVLRNLVNRLEQEQGIGAGPAQRAITVWIAAIHGRSVDDVRRLIQDGTSPPMDDNPPDAEVRLRTSLPDAVPHVRRVQKRLLWYVAAAAVVGVLIVGALVVVLQPFASDEPSARQPKTSAAPPSAPPSSPTQPPPFRLSPSTLLVTSRTNEHFTMYSIDLAVGKTETVPPAEGQSRVPQLLPTISPDRTSFVYLVGSPGGDPKTPWLRTGGQPDRPLFTETSPCTQSSRPSFSPDGQELAVICPSKQTGVAGLYIISLDGSLKQTLLSDGKVDGGPTWTDSGGIIFPYKQKGHDVLFIIDPAHPATRIQLTRGGGSDSHPDWSAAHGLLFLRTQNGQSDIWVKPAPGTEPHRLTDGGVFDAPAWSANGQEIAFLRMSDSQNVTLMTMTWRGAGVKPAPWPSGAGSAGPPAWGSR